MTGVHTGETHDDAAMPDGPVSGAAAGISASGTSRGAGIADDVIEVTDESLPHRQARHKPWPHPRRLLHLRESGFRDVSPRSEHVEIERRPVDRTVEPGRAAFRDRTIEAGEIAEEPVVSKEARVVEEPDLRKRTDTDTDTDTVTETVSHTEVEDDRGGLRAKDRDRL